jgi:hypothetical protein
MIPGFKKLSVNERDTTKPSKPKGKNITPLKCVESWCGYEWEVNYPIAQAMKDNKITVRRMMWAEGLKEKEITTFTVKCPLCGGENVKFN